MPCLSYRKAVCLSVHPAHPDFTSALAYKNRVRANAIQDFFLAQNLAILKALEEHNPSPSPM